MYWIMEMLVTHLAYWCLVVYLRISIEIWIYYTYSRLCWNIGRWLKVLLFLDGVQRMDVCCGYWVPALIRRCDDLPATITHVPVAAVLVLNTPDNGRLRQKHVEWLCRNKTCTVLHQVGVSFDLYYNERKQKIKNVVTEVFPRAVG